MADLLSSQVRKRKFQQREIDFDQLTDEELQSIYSFDRESIKYVLEILKDDLQRQTRGNNAQSPILAPIFHAIFTWKRVVEISLNRLFLALIWD